MLATRPSGPSGRSWARSHANRRNDNDEETPPVADLILIEDNPGDVELMRTALEEAGLRASLHVAEDAPRAFTLMSTLERIPDLVVLDLNLPRVSGRELLTRIRDGSRWRDVPIVVLTSSESEHEMESCLHLGASAYKVKPALFDGYVAFARSLVGYLSGSRLSVAHERSCTS